MAVGGDEIDMAKGRSLYCASEFIIHIINETQHWSNDGQITAWVAPEDYISPFGPLKTGENDLYGQIMIICPN